MFYNDEEFWRKIIDDPIKYWNQKIDLYNFVISDWIARIPGLYWTQSSEQIRQHKNEDIALQSKQWIEFYPPGKSKKVMGGVGTLLLPPTDEGKVKNVDAEIERFFKEYSKKEGRKGEYLLNPNIVNPIFESRYSCPSELSSTSEKVKLNLLYERIRGVYFKEQSLELLMIKLPQYYQSSVSIRTLSKNIGLNVSLLEEGSAVNISYQLIDLCIKKGIVENLIDRIILEYPKIFN